MAWILKLVGLGCVLKSPPSAAVDAQRNSIAGYPGDYPAAAGISLPQRLSGRADVENYNPVVLKVVKDVVAPEREYIRAQHEIVADPAHMREVRKLRKGRLQSVKPNGGVDFPLDDDVHFADGGRLEPERRHRYPRAGERRLRISARAAGPSTELSVRRWRSKVRKAASSLSSDGGMEGL